MKRLVLAFCVLWALGCSGITESALKAGGVEIDPDGNVTMTLPDGSVVRATEGGEVPTGFDIPPPFDGAEPMSVTEVSQPTGATQIIVSYDMTRPRNEIISVYADWFAANVPDHQHVKESQAGVATEVYSGDFGGGTVAVTVTEAFGSNTVSVMKETKATDEAGTD